MSNKESLAIQPNVYYTVEEAAELLRVSRQALLRLLRSGQTNAIKIGKQWRILGAALLDLSYLEKQTDNSLVADWLNVSNKPLKEVWDNEEDAVYDDL